METREGVRDWKGGLGVQPRNAVLVPPTLHSCRNGPVPGRERCLHRRGLLGLLTHLMYRPQVCSSCRVMCLLLITTIAAMTADHGGPAVSSDIFDDDLLNAVFNEPHVAAAQDWAMPRQAPTTSSLHGRQQGRRSLDICSCRSEQVPSLTPPHNSVFDLATKTALSPQETASGLPPMQQSRASALGSHRPSSNGELPCHAMHQQPSYSLC